MTTIKGGGVGKGGIAAELKLKNRSNKKKKTIKVMQSRPLTGTEGSHKLIYNMSKFYPISCFLYLFLVRGIFEP